MLAPRVVSCQSASCGPAGAGCKRCRPRGRALVDHSVAEGAAFHGWDRPRSPPAPEPAKDGRKAMYVMVRKYADKGGLLDQLVPQVRDGLLPLLKQAPGF